MRSAQRLSSVVTMMAGVALALPGLALFAYWHRELDLDSRDGLAIVVKLVPWVGLLCLALTTLMLAVAYMISALGQYRRGRLGPGGRLLALPSLVLGLAAARGDEIQVLVSTSAGHTTLALAALVLLAHAALIGWLWLRGQAVPTRDEPSARS